jgi:hypothetical protein
MRRLKSARSSGRRLAAQRAGYGTILLLIEPYRAFLMRALVHCVIAAAILCGCASSHNLSTDGANLLGGGYFQNQVHDGIFQISVKTNFGPWANTYAARSSWRERAAALCGSDRFRELEIAEGSYDQTHSIGLLRQIVTTRDGYAVCERAKLSDDAALALIRKK